MSIRLGDFAYNKGRRTEYNNSEKLLVKHNNYKYRMENIRQSHSADFRLCYLKIRSFAMHFHLLHQRMEWRWATKDKWKICRQKVSLLIFDDKYRNVYANVIQNLLWQFEVIFLWVQRDCINPIKSRREPGGSQSIYIIAIREKGSFFLWLKDISDVFLLKSFFRS